MFPKTQEQEDAYRVLGVAAAFFALVLGGFLATLDALFEVCFPPPRRAAVVAMVAVLVIISVVQVANGETYRDGAGIGGWQKQSVVVAA